MSGDPSLDHTENILEFERIVTNVAIAHATIALEDDQIKAHKKQQLILLRCGDPSLDHIENGEIFRVLINKLVKTERLILDSLKNQLNMENDIKKFKMEDDLNTPGTAGCPGGRD